MGHTVTCINLKHPFALLAKANAYQIVLQSVRHSDGPHSIRQRSTRTLRVPHRSQVGNSLDVQPLGGAGKKMHTNW